MPFRLNMLFCWFPCIRACHELRLHLAKEEVLLVLAVQDRVIAIPGGRYAIKGRGVVLQKLADPIGLHLQIFSQAAHFKLPDQRGSVSFAQEGLEFLGFGNRAVQLLFGVV